MVIIQYVYKYCIITITLLLYMIDICIRIAFLPLHYCYI